LFSFPLLVALVEVSEENLGMQHHLQPTGGKLLAANNQNPCEPRGGSEVGAVLCRATV